MIHVGGSGEGIDRRACLRLRAAHLLIFDAAAMTFTRIRI
jgi:hypothetical protein